MLHEALNSGKVTSTETETKFVYFSDLETRKSVFQKIKDVVHPVYREYGKLERLLRVVEYTLNPLSFCRYK